MKKHFQVALLILVLAACSDFFPERVIEREAPAAKTAKDLPQKAVSDANACAYGELTEGDVRHQFLWNLATKSVCPKVQEFRYNLTLLRLSAQQACLNPANKRSQNTMQHLWFGTIASFQYLIANPMEPLRASSGKLGMEIYAWPNANKFSLNAEYIKASQQDAAYTMQLAPSRKGLAQIERLIFNPQAQLSPGLSGRFRPEEDAFNALPLERRQRARCLVLSQMIDDVAIQTETLYQEWDAGQKQYPRQMLARLKGGSLPMVLNEVSDGLFYLEKVKDFKLGLPLGQNARCRLDRCPEEIELLISGAGIEALRANYDAFRAGLSGEHGPGFLDLVRAVGRTDLAQTMQNLIDGMELSLKDVEAAGDLRAQVEAVDKAQCADIHSSIPICRFFFQYKAFSTLYRSDFMTALNLNPPRTEADND